CMNLLCSFVAFCGILPRQIRQIVLRLIELPLPFGIARAMGLESVHAGDALFVNSKMIEFEGCTTHLATTRILLQSVYSSCRPLIFGISHLQSGDDFPVKNCRQPDLTEPFAFSHSLVRMEPARFSSKFV